MNSLYPIAKCPQCRRTILYSDDPRDKLNIKIRLALDNHIGIDILCPKCKKKLAISGNSEASGMKGEALQSLINDR